MPAPPTDGLVEIASLTRPPVMARPAMEPCASGAVIWNTPPALLPETVIRAPVGYELAMLVSLGISSTPLVSVMVFCAVVLAELNLVESKEILAAPKLLAKFRASRRLQAESDPLPGVV